MKTKLFSLTLVVALSILFGFSRPLFAQTKKFHSNHWKRGHHYSSQTHPVIRTPRPTHYRVVRKYYPPVRYYRPIPQHYRPVKLTTG